MSQVMLMNGLISGHAVMDFSDTHYGECSLLNVSIGCDGESASAVAEYVDRYGDIVGVCLRFACASQRDALKAMYSIERLAGDAWSIRTAVNYLDRNGFEIYDYSVVTLDDGYHWPDVSEVA